MKLGSALAYFALAALIPSAPAIAAKDDKLPRCNGQQKRPANLYGTVLPALPGRNATPTAAQPPVEGVPRGTASPQSTPAPTTDLFPPESSAPGPQGPADAPQAGKVPAIGALDPSAGPTAALPISFASC